MNAFSSSINHDLAIALQLVEEFQAIMGISGDIIQTVQVTWKELHMRVEEYVKREKTPSLQKMLLENKLTQCEGK